MATPVAPSVGEKTLAVLSAAVPGARFADVVSTTGLPKATVHRILHQLTQLEYIARDSADVYFAGPKMLGLAGRALDGFNATPIAQPIAARLAIEVDCTVHVGAETTDQIVYLVRQDASKPYRMNSRVGASMPMHSSGMGKSILATWPNDRVVEYAHRTGLVARTSSTITSVDALLADLDKVRSNGYAMDLCENEPGIVCVAVAIEGPLGRIAHALSISTIELERPGTSMSELAGPAQAAAAEISRRLGAHTP